MARYALSSRRPNVLQRRMSPMGALFLLLICFIGAAVQARAQSGRAKPQTQSDQPIRLRAEEVLVPVNVQSDTGKLPDHLTASDLIVVEDNSRRAITDLLRTPASIVLIVDNCIALGSVSVKQVNLNRDAALSVIDSMGGDDKAAILTYAGKVNLLSGWTGDKQALRIALTERFKLGAKSYLYDSLVYAAEELLAKAPGRHTVVLFTDGYDDFPKNALDKATQALDRARATVYTIDQSSMIVKELKPAVTNKSPSNLLSLGLQPSYREMIADWQRYMGIIQEEEKTMKSLAEDSGGTFWDPGDAAEFRKDWGALISAMGSEYVVAYFSDREAGDTALHELKVYPSSPGLEVKARHGVYASQ
jgi:VWFA-related protein